MLWLLLWTRKGLWFTPVGAFAAEYKRPVRFVLLQQTRVLEPRDHGLLSLQPRVRDRADLLAVEVGPLLVVKLLVEPHNVRWIHEVDERVAHVALVLEIDGQVEEVVLAVMALIDLL